MKRYFWVRLWELDLEGTFAFLIKEIVVPEEEVEKAKAEMEKEAFKLQEAIPWRRVEIEVEEVKK